MSSARMCPITNERILVATDGSNYSEGAVREAISFSKICSSNLTVMTVLEVIADGETATQLVEEEMEAEARRRLDAVKEQARQEGVECETFIAFGDPHQSIIDEAAKRKIDIIFMGRRGRTGLGKLLMGEVATKVVGNADCKVIVVPSAAAIGPKNILIATDGSGHSLAAVEEGIKIAAKCGSSVIAFSSARSQDKLGAAKANVDKVLEMAKGMNISAEGLTPIGRSKDLIPETAAGRGVDLIVMGVPVISGVKKLFSGSATEQVIGKAGCAVLIVKGGEAPATV